MDRKPLARPHRGHARVHETDARPIGESRLISERDAPSWSPCSFETQGGDSPLNCRYQLVLYRKSRGEKFGPDQRPAAGLAIKAVERSRWRDGRGGYGYSIGSCCICGVMSSDVVWMKRRAGKGGGEEEVAEERVFRDLGRQ